MRPVVHSYAPFLVERPFEQIKLDLGHQDVGAVLVSIGASYDASAEGRTHQAPGDVALLATVPGFAIHVPGHPDEAEQLLRREFARDGRAYVRLSAETNAEARPVEQLTVVREGRAGGPLVLAVGPTLDQVLAATADLAVTVAYTSTVLPFPAPSCARSPAGATWPSSSRTWPGTSAAALADAPAGSASAPAHPGRAAARAPPLRPARGAPPRLRPRRRGHPPLARRLPRGRRTGRLTATAPTWGLTHIWVLTPPGEAWPQGGQAGTDAAGGRHLSRHALNDHPPRRATRQRREDWGRTRAEKRHG